MIENIINYKDGYFIGEEELEIYYRQYEVEDSKASIVISHGFCETSEKYIELIEKFNDNKYSVYIFDHRGHGKSSRLGIDNSQIYVSNFMDYVKDLKTFLDSVVVPELKGEKLFLFAHSMGGCIGGLFLETYPDYFDCAILNTPMMDIDTGKYPKCISKLLASLACMVGKGKNYIIGHGPFNPNPNIEASGTSCEERYMKYFNKMLKDENLQNSGASYKWLKEAFKGIKAVTRKENVEKIHVPVLLFQAGKDTFVKPKGHEKFCNNSEKCKLNKIEDAKHEIYIEKNEIVDEYMKEVLDFYEENLDIKKLYNLQRG